MIPAQREMSASGLFVETKSSAPSSSEIVDWATVFGVALALGILAMSVGLIRSESAKDLRTLAATGASGFARRAVTAATAGGLAFLGAVLGTVGGYVACISWFLSTRNTGPAALGYPGTGAVCPPQSLVDDLNAGGSRATAVLFPPKHEAAAAVLAAALAAYPSAPPVPQHVLSARGTAVLRAWAGKDAALQRFGQIAAPTLVADGALDRLVPAVNDRRPARGIAGAELHLYHDAGHAFLFQDLTTFAPALESFLSG